jgi:hypothetical protein
MNASEAIPRSTGRQLMAGVLTAGLSTGLAATLLAATMTTSAAAPTRYDGEAGSGKVEPAWRVVEVACFTTPHQWNAALDGPVPRCYRTVR